MTYEFSSWPREQQEHRMNELLAAADNVLSEERKAQVARELSHLLFEMNYRAEQTAKPDV